MLTYFLKFVNHIIKTPSIITTAPMNVQLAGSDTNSGNATINAKPVHASNDPIFRYMLIHL